MRIANFVAGLLIAAASVAAGAQAAPSAYQRSFSLTAGAFASGFRPDWPDGSAIDATVYPLFGPGAFVDARFTHWFQVEAEGRWLRFNEYYGESEDNYLIGPRVPIKRFGKFQTYGKALIGLGKMQFPEGDVFARGSYTAIALGGTLDYQLSHRFTVRALDFEYQDWPLWPGKFPAQVAPGTIPYGNYSKSLQPIGLSVGIGYRIF
jgi:hypothetical protein